jgi:hypothetical protein
MTNPASAAFIVATPQFPQPSALAPFRRRLTYALPNKLLKIGGNHMDITNDQQHQTRQKRRAFSQSH